MHSLFKGVILICGLSLITCTPVPLCPAATTEQAKQAEAALADFAVNLYKNISSQDQNKDQVLSPVSIALALAMLENGADSATRQQLDNVLVGLGATADVLTAYRAIQLQLAIDDDRAKLSIANGLFEDKTLILKDNYISTTRDCLQAQVDNTNDFAKQLDQTRKNINKWVSDKTMGKIYELYKPGALNKAARMVLANAIYFKSSWLHPFNGTQTKHQTFYKYGQEGSKENVPFMIANIDLMFGSTNDVDTLQLPFQHPDLAFYVILPKVRDGLQKFEQGLTGTQLRSLFSNLQAHSVTVQLPKFVIRTSIDLTDTLSKMGLASMFTNAADFSRMSDTPLKVDGAIHQGYINVNENGTEASAATAVSIAGATAYLQPATFIADHPFLYTIVHRQTGAIVFLGKLTDAKAHNE